MRKLLFLFFAVPLAAQTVNPTTQIQWNRLAGVGSPASNGFVCTSNSIGTATNAIQGEMYTDQAGPHYWTCAKPSGTPAWFQVDNPGNATIIQVNGTPTTPVSPVDLNDTTPAPDAGYINAKVRQDGSAHISFEVPSVLGPALRMNPGEDATHVFIPFGSCALTSTNMSLVDTSYSSCDALGGQFQIFAGGLFNHNTSVSMTWSNPVLPSWLPAGNVTGVQIVGYSSGFSWKAAGGSGTCGGSGSCAQNWAPETIDGPTTVTVTGVTGANFSSLTAIDTKGYSVFCNFCSSPFTIVANTVVPQVGVLVEFSGVTNPNFPSTDLEINDPLQYNHEKNSLGVRNTYPSALFSVLTANLPAAPPELTTAITNDNTTTTFGAVCTGSGSINTGFAWCAYSAGQWYYQGPLAGGGGSGVTSVGSGAGLTGGPIDTAHPSGTLSIDFSSANTWTGKQTQPAPILSDLTGSTQCLHVDSSGQVSGTGSDCGAGGGGSGTVSGQSANVVGLATGPTTTGAQSHINEASAGVTTVTQPLAVDDGTGQGGTVDLTEGTAATAAAGHDLLYADSTAHCIKQSLNGGSFACLGTGSGAVNVNGSSVSSPNFNGSTPGPGSNGKNVAFQASGSSVSAELVGDGNAGHYLDGTGNYSVPPGTGASSVGNKGTANCSTGSGGFQACGFTNGIVYEKSYWANLSDFTTVGTAPTLANGAIVLTGPHPGTSFDDQALVLPTITQDEAEDAEVLFTSSTQSSTTFGIGLGRLSLNQAHYAGSVSCQLQLVSGANLVNFWQNASGSTFTQIGSTHALGFSIGATDLVRFVCGQRANVITAIVQDYTSGNSVTFSITQNMSTSPNFNIPATSQWKVMSFGGTQTISSLKITSYQPMSCNIAVLGDSKMFGFSTGSTRGRTATMLDNLGPVCHFAGVGDETVQAVQTIPFLLNFQPKYTIVNIGRNDLADGVATATWQANYSSIISQLQAGGTTVINLLPIPETAQSQTTLTSYITTTFPAIPAVDVSTCGWSNGTDLSSDNIHPNLTGAQLIWNCINSSGFITAAQANVITPYQYPATQ